nr:hypothetical protein [Tanacetum cinerariifolium]
MQEPEKIVEMGEDAKGKSLEIPTVEQPLDEVDEQNKAFQKTPESPYDTKSVSGFEGVDSDNTQGNDVSHSDHTFPDQNAFAKRLSLPDHLDHICEEVSSLHSKLGTMESFIIHQEQLPGLLSAALKDCLPSIIQESLHTYIQASSESFAEKQTKLNKKVVKHLNRQFNIFHVTQIVIVNNTVEGEKNKKAKDPNLVATQGEPQSVEPLVKSQGEQPADLNVVNKESAPPASNAKLNEGKELVVHNSEEKKSEEILLVEDNSDEDDKHPLSKRFKIMTPILDILNPTPLNTFVLKSAQA